MIRDMELVRTILLWVDQCPEMDGNGAIIVQNPEQIGAVGYSVQEISYHVNMLLKAELLQGKAGSLPVITSLTWEGHEFLDTIRNPEIWRKTKDRLAGLGSIAISVVWEVAKAELKKKLGLP
jgi:hypothetical protein